MPGSAGGRETRKLNAFLRQKPQDYLVATGREYFWRQFACETFCQLWLSCGFLFTPSGHGEMLEKRDGSANSGSVGSESLWKNPVRPVLSRYFLALLTKFC